MSREDAEGFRLPKKPIKVTPVKKEEESETNRASDNQFFSLSEETKYHTIRSFLTPERKMSTDLSWYDKAGNKVKTEDPKPDQTSSDTKIKTETLEPTLYQALDELIEDFNLGDKKWRNHDIIKGLDRQGVKSWNTFITMDGRPFAKTSTAQNYSIQTF